MRNSGLFLLKKLGGFFISEFTRSLVWKDGANTNEP